MKCNSKLLIYLIIASILKAKWAMQTPGLLEALKSIEFVGILALIFVKKKPSFYIFLF